jgi:hypothetical protein
MATMAADRSACVLASGRPPVNSTATPAQPSRIRPSARLVELADQLAERGIEPITVVAHNRVWTDVLDGRHRLEFVEDAAGQFLLIDCGEGRLRISPKPTAGWLADFHRGKLVYSRIDLYAAISGVPSVRPGVPLAELPPGRLANLVSRILRDEAWTELPRLDRLATSREDLDPAQLIDAAGYWLQGLGFTDAAVSPGPKPTLSSDSFHITYHRKQTQVTLAEAKAMFVTRRSQGCR